MSEYTFKLLLTEDERLVLIQALHLLECSHFPEQYEPWRTKLEGRLQKQTVAEALEVNCE